MEWLLIEDQPMATRYFNCSLIWYYFITEIYSHAHMLWISTYAFKQWTDYPIIRHEEWHSTCLLMMSRNIYVITEIYPHIFQSFHVNISIMWYTHGRYNIHEWLTIHLSSNSKNFIMDFLLQWNIGPVVFLRGKNFLGTTPSGGRRVSGNIDWTCWASLYIHWEW